MYRKHAENDNAPSHSTWKEKRERGREKERGKQKERGGARETHRRACFIKVQVQDLSDCQVVLSFWFHINVVSFLPPLSSPAPLHSSPCSAVCSFSSAPLTPGLYRKRRRKVWQKLSALQPCFFIFGNVFFKVWNGNKQATIKLKRNSNLHFSTLLLIKVRDAHILTRCHSFLVSQLEGVLCHCQ